MGRECLGTHGHKLGTKEMFISFVVAISLAAGLFYYLESLDDVDIKACKELDAKYGEILTARKGPFVGVALTAIRFSDTAITVRLPDSSEMVFICNGLERIKRIK